MPDGFLLGVFFAIVLLAIGVLAGLVAARFLWPQTSGGMEQLHPVLSGLMQFTSRFSKDVSEYSSLIEIAAERARAIDNRSNDPGDPPGPSSSLLAQIVQANDHLRKRLDEAEASLQCQSAELSSYMTEARTDALTGLPNRRAFDDELNRRMALYRRQGTPLAVLLLDVDRFKSVNDRFGHHHGDQVLKAVAESLRQAVRDCDLIARYGGEEFGVLLAGSTPEEFQGAAERVRRIIEQTEIDCDGTRLIATVSCGVAAATGGEDTVSLVRRADEALYASKTGGRNCSHWHDDRRVVPITPAATNAALPVRPAGTNASENFGRVCADLRRKLMELTQ